MKNKERDFTRREKVAVFRGLFYGLAICVPLWGTLLYIALSGGLK